MRTRTAELPFGGRHAPPPVMDENTQALNRIADALEAVTRELKRVIDTLERQAGAPASSCTPAAPEAAQDAPCSTSVDRPQLPPWITDHLPTVYVAYGGWVQVRAGGILATFRNGDRGRIKPWNAVRTGEAWAPLYTLPTPPTPCHGRSS